MAKWSEGVVRKVLQDKQWLSSEKKIQHGVQFSLSDGSTMVNWFHTGKINVQGKAAGALREAAERSFADAPKYQCARSAAAA